MYIPTEILRAFSEEATRIPEAFDSSLDSVLRDDREVVLAAIHRSMLTKTALSLVSKLFHELVEEFLYEIISVNRFDHIPRLVKLLQSQASNHPSSKPRGLHCRRLEICLGTGAIDYNDEAWYEGGHVLWGLLPACPNVTILLCRIWKRNRNSLLARSMPHLTNPTLWKIILATCGLHLRRLELYGLSIRMDRVEMLLRYFTKLEVCRLVHVRPFDDRETYDGDEPTFLEFSRLRSSTVVSDQTLGMPSRFFGNDVKRGFDDAKSASWPAFLHRPPYKLPSLHTLHIDRFNPRITQLDIPNLRYLGMYNTEDAGRDVVRDISGTNWPKSLSVSLTHLSLGGYSIPLQTLLERFPNIRELALHYDYETSAQSVVTCPHHTLAVIKYHCADNPVDMSNHIADLLSVAQSGMLSCLNKVLIMRWWSSTKDGGLPWGKFHTLGVELQVKVVKPHGRYKVKGRFEFPEYTFDQ